MRGTTDGDDPELPGRRRRDGTRERLRAELMALRDGLDVPDTDGATMAERVLAQILAGAVPVPASVLVAEPAGRLERVRAWWLGRKDGPRSPGSSA
ncbi:hypothetical protein [Streptomyces sp. HB132]|uniref:hypothetical protein n=1 Tax=Streptomyces sp. HB132 TaxID=767388 RepID=UPI00195FB1EC|nr:hypothetical protein [Streptomyces sp. HB132]MBM7437174.1 hypothetical protein [Streptomyces sp. HB132]